MWKSFRNLPRVDVVRGVDVNAFHVLLRKSVVFVEDALDAVLGRLSEAGEKTEEPGHAE